MKLDFFVPGFSKCGTTTLCAMLGEHPQIFVPEAKEPNFFGPSYDKGWEWYEKFFTPAREGQIVGEGSTFYSAAEFADVACARIIERFPDARFLFIARNPLKRIESSYREMHNSGYKYGINAPYSIGEALRSFSNMLDDTLYWARLSTFRKFVPDDRILLIFLEDFQRDPAAELARCFQFLGVDPSARIGDLGRRLNPGEAKTYDSRLMRFIRTHKWPHRIWIRLPDRAKDQLSKRLGLRKPFNTPLHWDAETRRWVFERIGDDVRQLLAYGGKPADFWKLC
jgi:hypothetical protein